jgi:tetratricopeptide (TPR) repeat protein
LGAFKKLVEKFPDEPHFWGHLGRFYAIELHRDEEALTAIDRAIELDSKNNVFYHMKGMVLRQQLYVFLETLKQRGYCSSDDFEIIQHKVEEAGELFEKARSLSAPQEEHAYVSHIQLLIRVVDFGFAISKQPSRAEFLISKDAAWYRELIDVAEHLLDELRRKQEGGLPSLYTTRCQTGLDELYGDYSRVLEGWNILLDRKDIYLPTVRRQIARVYLLRRNRSWDELNQSELRRVAELMQANIEADPTDYRSLRYWFQAVRRIDGQSIEAAIERLSYWKANTSEPLEATFYLYILYTLQSLDGLTSSVSKASGLMTECSTLARNLTIRHNNIEWYGKGVGMKRILHYSQLPEPWEKEFEKGEMLSLVDGRVYRIFGPEAGQTELSCGLIAFFVPERGFKRPFVRSRDENKAVHFYLSFTYDGLRAWAVRDAS